MSTFNTGDLPTEALLPQQNTLSRHLRYAEVAILFSGCLDAADNLPAGSHRSVILDGEAMSAPTSVSRMRAH